MNHKRDKTIGGPSWINWFYDEINFNRFFKYDQNKTKKKQKMSINVNTIVIAFVKQIYSR